MISRLTFLLFFIIYSIQAEEKWTGKWFPENPETKSPEETKSTSPNEKGPTSKPEFSYDENLVNKQKSSGWNWFPSDPNVVKDDAKSSNTDSLNSTADKANWDGKWFPEHPAVTTYHENTYEHDRIMGIPNSNCDDGQANLHVDFDPSSSEHTKMYTCLESTLYKPNSNLEPIETIYTVPKFYTPVHKCMNETIAYDQKIPTLGYHRPLWPMYGEYKFVPPQRWLHSLEHGAVVMLYDPCAVSSEVDKLKNLLKSCLFRHIITPYKLSQDRPLALVAWATSLEMSAFDKSTVVDFIKKNAKSGPEKVSRQGQYKAMLIDESKIISDSDDSEICGNISTMM